MKSNTGNYNVGNSGIISDETITNLKPLSFQTIADNETIEFIHWHCQKILELSKEKNSSKEVARAINLHTYEVLGTIMGDAHSVDIDVLVHKMEKTEYAFLVMHNHPSNEHFSYRDLKTFIDSINITILIVIGNQGAVYIIEKTKQLSLTEILSVKKNMLNWKNGIIDYRKLLNQLSNYGIVYTAE